MLGLNSRKATRLTAVSFIGVFLILIPVFYSSFVQAQNESTTASSSSNSSNNSLASHWVPNWSYRGELNPSDEDYYNFWSDDAGKILSMAVLTSDATDAAQALTFLESEGLGSVSYYIPEVRVNSSIANFTGASTDTLTNRIVQLEYNQSPLSSLESLTIGDYFSSNTTMGYLGPDRLMVGGSIERSSSSIVSNITNGFSKRSFFRTPNGDFYEYLNATISIGEPYVNISIQVVGLNSSVSSNDLLYLQDLLLLDNLTMPLFTTIKAYMKES